MAIFPLSPLILTTYYYITTASVTFLVVFKVILLKSCGELIPFLAYTVIISKKCKFITSSCTFASKPDFAQNTKYLSVKKGTRNSWSGQNQPQS